MQNKGGDQIDKKPIEDLIEKSEQQHLGCPNVVKGQMTFMKDTHKGQLWYCHGCKTVVRTILFPSYEQYQEMYKRRKRRKHIGEMDSHGGRT